MDAVILLGVGIQSNQARLEREGAFFPEFGLDRITAFHDRQDARYADLAGQVREAGWTLHDLTVEAGARGCIADTFRRFLRDR